MASKLSKSDFGPEHFRVTEDISTRALLAEHTYVFTRIELAVCFGDESRLDEVFRLAVDLEDRMHSSNSDLLSPVLEFTMAVAYRKNAWENIGVTLPAQTQTWFTLDTGFNMLRLSGRLATQKYVAWRTDSFVPFLEKLGAEYNSYVARFVRENTSMLEEARRNRTVSSPSVLAHFGLADLPLR